MRRDREYRDDSDVEDELLGRSEDVGEEEDTFDPFDDDDAGDELCEHGNHPASCEWCLDELLEGDVAAAGDEDDDS